MTLRDFAYIDFERVRSYLAQMNGKLSEQISETTQHAAGGEAGVQSTGVAKLLVDVEAKGNYMYTKLNSETSSLHHAIFGAFESGIEAQHLAGTLDDERPFAEVTCRIKVVDYRLLAEQFRSVASLTPVIGRISTTGSSGGPKQRNKTSSTAGMRQITDVAKAVELLFGEVRVLQLIDDSGNTIAQAFLNDELLPQKSVFFAHNNEVLPEEWTVYCLKPLKQKTINLPVHDGDDLAAKLQQAGEALRDIKQMIMPDRKTPTIVPIAIYRVLEP